jgi:hypothetical protein
MSTPERIVLSDDDDDEAIEPSPAVMTAPPRPIKRRKQVVPQEPEQEQEQELQETRLSSATSVVHFLRFVILAALVGSFLTGLGYGFFVWIRTWPTSRNSFHSSSSVFTGAFRNTTSVYALYNTTTADIVWNVRKTLQETQQAFYDRFPCLCMHHLNQLNASWTLVRLCNVYNLDTGQHYFLVNPRVIGALRADLQVPKLELSISCKESRDRHIKRHTAVFIEWEDEASRTHYALFRDQAAYCIQLAINEFEGPQGPQCA